MYKTILSTQKRRHALRAHHFRKRFWGGLRDLDITSQGVSTKAIIEKLLSGRANIETDSISGGWEFFYEFGDKRYIKDGKSYNLNCAIACGGATDHLWTLEPVDKIPVNFDVNVATGRFGSTTYYTTLYTSFPYSCGSGVEAYYVIKKDSSSWDTISVPNNIVPSKTGVILKSSSDIGYIRPVFEEPNTLTGNLLKGVINLLGDSTLYNSNTMRILGTKSSNSALDFVVSDSKYVESNTAYLDISQIPAYTQNNLTRKINSTTGISTLSIDKAEDNAIYDLSGRKVTAKILPKGIYIKNGKKFIVK